MLIGDGEHARVVSSWAYEHGPGDMVAIGDIQTRVRVVRENPRRPWVTLIHPTAVRAHGVTVGEGTYVGAAAVLQFAADLGDHVIVGTGAIVEHNVRVGDFCNIGPGVVIGGGTVIGDRTLLGLGCRIRDHVRVGSGVTVGMGAVVVSNVPDGATVMGMPARQ